MQRPGPGTPAFENQWVLSLGAKPSVGRWDCSLRTSRDQRGALWTTFAPLHLSCLFLFLVLWLAHAGRMEDYRQPTESTLLQLAQDGAQTCMLKCPCVMCEDSLPNFRAHTGGPESRLGTDMLTGVFCLAARPPDSQLYLGASSDRSHVHCLYWFPPLGTGSHSLTPSNPPVLEEPIQSSSCPATLGGSLPWD